MDAVLEAHLLSRCDTVWRGQLDRADEVSRVAALVDNPKLRTQATLTQSVIALERGDPGAAKRLAAQVIDATDGPQARLAAVVIAATRLDDRPELCTAQILSAAGAELNSVPASAHAWIAELLVRAEVALGRLDHAESHAQTITDPGVQKLASGRVMLARHCPSQARNLAEGARIAFAETGMRLPEGEAALLYGLASADLFEREQALVSLGAAKTIAESCGAAGLAGRVTNAMRTVGARMPRPRRQAGELTVREQEIVGLVGRGLTNRQIGERLHLSPRTVQSHLSQVFGKLNVTNRTALLAELCTGRNR